MKTAPTFLAKNRAWIGWGLLAMSLLLGLLTLYWGEFVDEADNLVVGSLLLQGRVLYRDVFSHHFPFAYYWMAGVVALAGKSIFAARFSVLLFQVASFALLMRLTQKHLLLGLTALMWSIARPFYLGHMVLYPSFGGVALLAVFLVSFFILEGTLLPTWQHWLTIGAYSLIAFLSNPLSAYAIGITLIFLFVRKPAWGLKAGSVIGAGLALSFGALVVSDSLQAFWQDVVVFNSQVYNKYTDAHPFRVFDLFTYGLTGLGLPYGHWFDFNPFKPIQDIIYAQIDAWFFTGFLYRLGVMFAALLLLLQRKFSAGIYLYAFATAVVAIAKVTFHAQPFTLVALTTLSALAINEFPLPISKPVPAALVRAARVLMILMTLWLGIRLSQQIILERQNLAYDKNFAAYEKQAANLQKLSCSNPDVRLAFYPAGVYQYWFSGLQPASKYIFMWPWVAEVGQDEMIRELQGQEFVIVVVRENLVWESYNSLDYLRPLIDYLEANYRKVSKEIYVSPALFETCPQ
ncbi:MAG: hypothetical protein AB1750_09415 [Chloroflexota bacterium]